MAAVAAGRVTAVALLAAVSWGNHCLAADRERSAKRHHQTTLTSAARLSFLRRAQVWSPTNVPEMDLRSGPRGPGAFAPGERVTCEYVKGDLSGRSPKFSCAVGEGDVVKVRYGQRNGEVEGSVLASRLLWALGFGADRVYPVRVICRGCSSDPWTMRERVPGEQVFDPAVIERRSAGRELRSRDERGWGWPDLDRVDEHLGGAPRAQRDALKLLAVLMQHTDSKTEQQRLLCLPLVLDGAREEEDHGCERPLMMVHDVGLTFGHANYLNRATTGSVNFEEWARTPIWRGPRGCVGHLSQSATGTLGDPTISEAGRGFLAGLLEQLTDQQLTDLFDVARVDRRSRRPDSALAAASVEEWVAAFKRKRDEIANTRCPS